MLGSLVMNSSWLAAIGQSLCSLCSPCALYLSSLTHQQAPKKRVSYLFMADPLQKLLLKTSFFISSRFIISFMVHPAQSIETITALVALLECVCLFSFRLLQRAEMVLRKIIIKKMIFFPVGMWSFESVPEISLPPCKPSASFFSCCRNWDSPTTSPAGEYASPPFRGEGPGICY